MKMKDIISMCVRVANCGCEEGAFQYDVTFPSSVIRHHI